MWVGEAGDKGPPTLPPGNALNMSGEQDIPMSQITIMEDILKG